MLIADINETYERSLAAAAHAQNAKRVLQTQTGDHREDYRAERHKERFARLAHDEAQKAAAGAFAELNGRRCTTSRHGFETEVCCRWQYDHSIIDHPILFREMAKPYRPVAIVTQPYNVRPEQLRPVRGKLGFSDDVELVWRVPPVPLASIHYPGSTFFYVLTRPGISVKWLPEQHHGWNLDLKRRET